MSPLTDVTDLTSIVTTVLSVVLTGLLLLSRQIVTRIREMLEENTSTTEKTASQVETALAELVKMRQQLTAYKVENRLYRRRFMAILSDPESLPAHRHLKDLVDIINAKSNQEQG